jgi:hypothetical protein
MKLSAAVDAAIPASQREAALEYVRKALNTYRRDKDRPHNSLSVSAQRKELKKIIRYAAKLDAALGTLTAEVAIRLPILLVEAPEVLKVKGSPYTYRLSADLDHLQRQAEQAFKSLTNADKTKPKDQAIHDLLVNLATAWCQAFPKQYGVTRRGDLDKYHGPLLEFVQQLFVIEGINLTGDALGKRLYDLDLPWRKKPLAS